MEIPNEVFQLYKDTCDGFINSNFGVNCKVVYPPKKIACSNCVLDTIGQKSSNRYRHGGPAPFNFGVCPLCGGGGYKEEEHFDSIKLRVYYTPKEWVNVGVAINVPAGSIQIIGFLTDFLKVNKSIEIEVNSDMAGYIKWRFCKQGGVYPWGFKQDRYFVCFLERV